MAVDLIVPKLGESITEAVISRWLKNVGEQTAMDEPVAELETDKVTLTLPAPSAGVLAEQKFGAGSTVKVGDVIGAIAPGGAPARPSSGKSGTSGTSPTAAAAQPSAPSAASAPSGPATRSPATAAPPAHVAAAPARESAGPAPAASSSATAAAVASAPDTGNGAEDDSEGSRPLSPAQRRARFEHGTMPALAPLPQGGASAPSPVAPGAPTPLPSVERADEEIVPMTPLRRTIAARLVEAQHTAAILTTFNEVDMSAVIELRARHQDAFVQKHGVKLGFMSFFAKACVESLKELPGLNAELRGDAILYKRHYDIGIAVGGGKGLVVPVVRDVDKLGFGELEKAVADLGQRARDSKLTLEELRGGTFSITNGGIYGSMMSTPLLNMPQTGILGMHNIVRRPMAVASGGAERIEVRPMMYLALSYDHRVVDGREAVQFLIAVKQRIEAPDRLLFGI